MENKNQYVFQVNLKGMIALLSEHIYSNPGTFVRELLQNGIDAITAFRSLNEFLEGTIHVYLKDNGSMVFEDNGIGLKEDEIHKVLTVIGESSKRGELDAKDFIGRFGIGLLSCFVVSNEIVFETRSALSKDSLRWCGKADGTYETIHLDYELPIGTRVMLTPKAEWRHLFEYDAFKRNLDFYGNALPYPIYLHKDEQTEQINDLQPKWLTPGSSKEELLAYGRKTFQSSFLDAVQIKTVAGEIQGAIYVLPFKTQFSGRLTHRIYLKRMLLGEEDCRLLPPWAFFVKCVFNAESLSSTGSRESLVNNEELRKAQKEIGEALKAYLKSLINTDRDLFNKILDIHFLHVKAIAVEDNEMFGLFMDTLPFETNKGIRNFGTIRRNSPVVYYTTNLDDFKQVRRIAFSQGLLVINAAYTFDESLLKKAARLYVDMELEEISPARILESFTDAAYTSHPEYTAFEKRCNQTLESFGCICKLKHFTPVDTPVIFIAGEKDTKKKELPPLANPINSILGAFAPKTVQTPPTLCLNLDNDLIDTLITLDDPVVFEAILRILYVQSLLLGKYPVNNEEMNLFNESLYQLIVMKMTDLLGTLHKN
ncbi:molecular chaperone HtpG [Bacteroidia bacterium]|nr:molecular chaperone HtpG [Bacteroidia bacterium]